MENINNTDMDFEVDSETKKEIKDKIDREIALYHILIDSYKESHPFRAKLLRNVLEHMVSKLKKDVAIFYLMEEFKTIK